jgi:CheY-like chemotaxis protein
MATNAAGVIPSPAETRRRTVLIVEDDSDVAMALSDAVEQHGLRALCASNGREALALLEVESPALMLIDLFMPVMNGVELLKIMKQSPALSAIPRIILTGANDQMIGVREDATVLYKPVDFAALTQILQRYCQPAPARAR